MIRPRWGVGMRVALAVLFAAGAVLVLDRVVRRTEAAAAAPAAAVELPAEPPTLRLLGRAARTVVLCASAEDVPPSAAPVLQVLAEGTVLLRRAAPRAEGPGGAAPGLAALIVPAARLAELTPRQRSGVLQVLDRVLIPGADPQRLAVRGVDAAPGDLAALLRWIH